MPEKRISPRHTGQIKQLVQERARENAPFFAARAFFRPSREHKVCMIFCAAQRPNEMREEERFLLREPVSPSLCRISFFNTHSAPRTRAAAAAV